MRASAQDRARCNRPGRMSDRGLEVRVVDGALDDATRAALVFDGTLVVHHNLPAMRELVRLTDRLVRTHFAGGDPNRAQQHMNRERLLAAAAAAQSRFGADPQYSAAFGTAIEQAGVDSAAAGWDKRILRVLPSGGSHAGGRHSSTHVHRDTWGSNLYAQVNWWAPLYPVEAGTTIVFYPRFWRRGLANSSKTWSYADYRAARRVENGVPVNDYPPAPVPLEAVPDADAAPMLIGPGDLLCFSAAHLHGGTDNRSGHIRFSVETRTVSLQDVGTGRAAPNVDGHGGTARLRWFRHMRSGAVLSD